MYRTVNKLLRARLKFYLLFVTYFVRYPSFRNNLFLDGRLADLNQSSTRIRSLLKLNPAWPKGHLLLGLLAYETFQLTKDPYSLGVLEISASALDELRYDKSAIGVLRLCGDFLNKNYPKINTISLDAEINRVGSFATRYLDILRLEIIGSSLLAEDKRGFAKNIFSKIHPEKRSQEVRVAFMMFEALGT